MKNQNIKYKNLYDNDWKVRINKKVSAGDLDLSLVFLKKINILKPSHKILEIGCGKGDLCNALYKLGYKNIIGVDISSCAIEYGKNIHPNIDLRRMDANLKLKFKNEKFDICCSFDLIEHLPNISCHFKEIFSLLKPNGAYLLQTPNILSNSIIETIRYGNFSWKIYHPSLQYSWTLRKKMKKVGFKKIKFVKIPPFSKYKMDQLPKSIKFLTKKIPWENIPVCLQTNFYIIAYK